MTPSSTVPLQSRIWTWLKIVLGLGLLYFSLRGVAWPELRSSLQMLRWGWLLAVLCAVLMGLWLKVLRWQALLRYSGLSVPWQRIGGAFFVGQAANIILPVRGGEVLRIGWLSANRPETAPVVTVTLVIEKYLDLVMLLLVSLGVTLLLPQAVSAAQTQRMTVLVGAVSLGLALLVIGISLWPWLQAHPWVRRQPWLARLTRWMDPLLNAGQWLRQPQRIVRLILLTILIWGMMWITNVLLFCALGLQPLWVVAGLVLVMIYLGVLPALMPGNLGPFYFFARLALTPARLPDAAAVAYAVALHALVTLPPLLLGGLALLFSSRHAAGGQGNE